MEISKGRHTFRKMKREGYKQFLNRITDLLVKDGLVYHIEDMHYTYVVPDRVHRNCTIIGHRYQRDITVINNELFWPGIIKDVREFIKNIMFTRQ